MNNKKIAAVAAVSVLLGSLSVSAFAQSPAEESYVYFIAEKSVLGQGLTCEPVKVEFSSGEKGIDLVKKAAEIDYTEGEWGPYIMGFKDTDTKAEVPEIIKSACKDWGERSKEGYLSSYDYTAESGWSYFVNDQYAMVGIGDYEPQTGDVIRFSFTVYGYGADLGVDNSSWGGAAALVTPAPKAELTRLAADYENKDSDEYKNAIAVLGNLTAEQADVDAAVTALGGSIIGDSEKTDEDNSSDSSIDDTSSESSTDNSESADDGKDDNNNGNNANDNTSDNTDSIDLGESGKVPPTGVGVAIIPTAITAAAAGIAFVILKNKKNV